MVKIIDTAKNLIERCRNGDVRAFDELISSHQNMVFSFIYRLLGNRDDSSDITQEVFIKFYNNIDKFKGECSLKTWLLRISSNEVKNFWKSKMAKNKKNTTSINDHEDDDTPLETYIPANSPSPRELASEKELVNNLEDQMMKLNEEFREVLILRFNEDLSYDEIASVLKTNIGTVKSRIARAREELKKLMEPFLK